jgi:hypothetical protein
VAFGVGKHLCPGNRLGLAEAEEAVAALLACFDVQGVAVPAAAVPAAAAVDHAEDDGNDAGSATGATSPASSAASTTVPGPRPTLTLACPTSAVQWAQLDSMQTLASLPVRIILPHP